MLACLLGIGLAFTAATFPGERMEDWIGKRQTIPPNPIEHEYQAMREYIAHA